MAQESTNKFSQYSSCPEKEKRSGRGEGEGDLVLEDASLHQGAWKVRKLFAQQIALHT
jgi:5-formyltetrahydrofolate cyclo-ligase